MQATDGSSIQFADQGKGKLILILHPGLDDGTLWEAVATGLAQEFRVLRLHRRQYRLDLPSPVSIAAEVEDIRTLWTGLGEKMLIVGHSSGGVVALEALVAMPDAFVGAFLYEPPIVTGPPLGGVAYQKAKSAIEEGKPGKAIRIFLAEVVKVPTWLAWVAGFFVPFVAKLRAFAPRQIADLGAIDALGLRLPAYQNIQVPIVLLGGDQSPAHLAERLDALEAVLPKKERIVLRGQGHDANRRAPEKLVQLIRDQASRVFAEHYR